MLSPNEAIRRYVKSGGANKRWVAQALRMCMPVGRVLHVGGHTGEECVLYTNFGATQVTWVEASTPTFEQCKRFVGARRKKDKVVQATAWSKSGVEMELSHSRKTKQWYSGRSTLFELRHQGKGTLQEPCTKETVMTTALDELFAPGFETLVLDIQGAEFEALKGMPNIVAEANNIVVEACWVNVAGGPSTMRDIIDWLWDFGFVMMYYRGYNEHWPFGDACFKRIPLPEEYRIDKEGPIWTTDDATAAEESASAPTPTEESGASSAPNSNSENDPI